MSTAELLAYVAVYAFHTIMGGIFFDMAIYNFKQNRNFLAGCWFMCMIWHIIGLAYIRFKY